MARFLRTRLLPALSLAVCLAAPAWTARAAEPDAAGVADEAADEDSDEEAEEEESGPRWRAKTDEQIDEEKAAAARTVGRRTARFLVKARDAFLEQKYDEADEVLARINLKRLNPYERALVYRQQGYVAYGKGQLGPAVELLNKALAENIFTQADSTDVLYQIAQMQMSQNEFEEALATMKAWFEAVEKPSAAGYFQLAIIYYQLKKLDDAVEPAQKAVELAGTPQQSWLQLLLAIYLTKEDYKSATPVLEDLLTRYPEVGKNYWLQLATLYGVQGDTPRALAILQLAHRQDFLTDDRDLRRLAGLLQTSEIPIRSAKILEEGLEQKRITEDAIAYELLGNSYIMARESSKAEPSLAKAADLSPEGVISVRLGQVLLLKDDYEGAAAALKQALAKGGLDDPGNAELLLGITYYNWGKLGEARTWFWRARRSQKSGTIAASWSEHIDLEIEKQNSNGDGSVGL